MRVNIKPCHLMPYGITFHFQCHRQYLNLRWLATILGKLWTADLRCRIRHKFGSHLSLTVKVAFLCGTFFLPCFNALSLAPIIPHSLPVIPLPLSLKLVQYLPLETRLVGYNKSLKQISPNVWSFSCLFLV